jgi:hypothetical protein
MAGGSPDHAALAAALIGIVRGKLRPGCRVELASVAARIAVDEVYRDGLEDAG